MMLRRIACLSLSLLPLLAACGDDESSLVGRWRSPSGQEVEFHGDGTVQLGEGFGARYHLTEEGALQIEQEMIGPVTMPLEMMGDSFRVEGRRVLGEGRLLFFRDTGELEPITYALAGEIAVEGTCTEKKRSWTSYGNPTPRSSPPVTEEVKVALANVFTGGELVLDPLTHGFTQKIAMKMRDAPIGGPLMNGRDVYASYEGRYVEVGGEIVLSYEDAGTLSQVEGRRDGNQIVLSSAEFMRVLMAQEGERIRRDFHTDSREHSPAWAEAPPLTFTISGT